MWFRSRAVRACGQPLDRGWALQKRLYFGLLLALAAAAPSFGLDEEPSRKSFALQRRVRSHDASDRSRWFGFTDDIVIRVAATDSGSRIDLRSSSRLGRSDFGVNGARIRAYLSALRASAGGEG